MLDKSRRWGLIVRATEAGGGYLAPHIGSIEKTLNGSMVSLHSTLDGQCQIELDHEMDASGVQRLAEQLHSLTDKRGHPLLEVEMTSDTPPVLRSHPARDSL